ncbi:hypothetical protein L5515_000775 [Caenorhabditis briggsae]|uniref:Uncharacterized protein n=1 Tax=Caenorhabditis briggsae TaxID=6238 RepID=A0AAE9E1J3_CAEBR|nr:hypothetical protein L5515_000775 [Caenorhabditis briggsae]
MFKVSQEEKFQIRPHNLARRYWTMLAERSMKAVKCDVNVNVEAFERKIDEGGNNSTLQKLQKQLRAAEIEVEKVQLRLDVAVIEKRELYKQMEAEELKYEWIKSVYGAKNNKVGTN